MDSRTRNKELEGTIKLTLFLTSQNKHNTYFKAKILKDIKVYI